MLLLVLILRVDELTLQAVHDRHFAQLCPEEVNFLRLILLMEEPPKAVLKERSHHHLVVAFADVAFIVEALQTSVINACKLFINLLHMLNCVLTDLLLKVSACLINLCIKLIFLS